MDLLAAVPIDPSCLSHLLIAMDLFVADPCEVSACGSGLVSVSDVFPCIAWDSFLSPRFLLSPLYHGYVPYFSTIISKPLQRSILHRNTFFLHNCVTTASTAL